MVAKKEITSAELVKMLTGVQQMLHWQMDLVEDALGRLETKDKSASASKTSGRKNRTEIPEKVL